MTSLSDLGTVTILFTDLVGSTELLEQLGDDQAEALRRAHFQLLRKAVAQHGGHEVKNLGDGLMVVFGSALDAVRCAVQMQEAVRSHNEAEGATPIQVRIGLHAGEPIRDENDYFGTPVVVAHRLCESARGGEVIASHLVRGLVGNRGEFRFRHLGDLQLKGLAHPLPADEVVWGTEAEGVSHRATFTAEDATPHGGAIGEPPIAPVWKRRRRLAAGAGALAALAIIVALFVVTLGGDGDDTTNFAASSDGSAAAVAPRLDEELHYRQELIYPNAILESSGIEERAGVVRATAQWLTFDSAEVILNFYEAAFASLGVEGDPARVSAPNLETLYITGDEEGAVVTVQIGAGPAQENRIIVGFQLE